MISRLSYRRSRYTYTGRALYMAKNYLFRGRTECGRKRILIVITDGASRDNIGRPAYQLRRAGVEIITISVGRAAVRQLRVIAADQRHVFISSVYRLRMLVTPIRNLACRGKNKARI